jgi:hypothetical protein
MRREALIIEYLILGVSMNHGLSVLPELEIHWTSVGIEIL